MLVDQLNDILAASNLPDVSGQYPHQSRDFLFITEGFKQNVVDKMPGQWRIVRTVMEKINTGP